MKYKRLNLYFQHNLSKHLNSLAFYYFLLISICTSNSPFSHFLFLLSLINLYKCRVYLEFKIIKNRGVIVLF